jgi:hypothetical protein
LSFIPILSIGIIAENRIMSRCFVCEVAPFFCQNIDITKEKGPVTAFSPVLDPASGGPSSRATLLCGIIDKEKGDNFMVGREKEKRCPQKSIDSTWTMIYIPVIK